MFQGQLVMPKSNQRSHHKYPAVTDILSWLQTHSQYMAVLLTSEKTSREGAAGLAAHMYLILQLSKDLEDSQWLHYDRDFHQWAAAKGVRKWVELNLSIYRRCLSVQKPATPSKAGNQGKTKKPLGACFQWNDSSCDQACSFRHVCSFCDGPYKRPMGPSNQEIQTSLNLRIFPKYYHYNLSTPLL